MAKAPPGLSNTEFAEWHMKHQGLGCGTWLFFALVLVIIVMVVEYLLKVEIPWWQFAVLTVVGTLWLGSAAVASA